MKSFVTYDILTDSTGKSVQRRFKHFDWLREQLQRIYPCITIPPIPGKEMKLQGKFDQDFVHQRTEGLQKFLDRVAVHPVLGCCSVVKHFLIAVEQKDWKIGKRDAEAKKVFTSSISMPSGTRTTGTWPYVADGSSFGSRHDWRSMCILLPQHTECTYAQTPSQVAHSEC
jgi:sorting nexin-9/18/33